MTVLIADEVLLAHLRGVSESVEIRAPNGKVLGHYTPVLTPEKAARSTRSKGLFDLEEAERILATERDQGRPLAKIWEEIHSLKKQG